jgi:hypothetical protein
MRTPLPLLCLTVLVCAGRSRVAHADPVRLHIVGPGQQPVAGAQVRVAQYQGYFNAGRAQVSELVSDENGRIALESKHPLKASPKLDDYSSRGFLAVSIVAPGLATKALLLKDGDNEIALLPGKAWGGVALDQAQKPVPGVRIILGDFWAPDSALTRWPEALRLETLTDKDGKWSFEGMPLAGKARLTVESALFKRETFSLNLDAPGAPPLFLERGVTIKGRLLRPDGQGAGNVTLYPGGSGDMNPFETNYRTAPDGSFEMSGLPEGDFYLQHIDMGDADNLPFIVEPLSVRGLKAGEVHDIGIWKTLKGLELRGTVVESGSKTPISGARIQGTGGTQHGTSDAKGNFAALTESDSRQAYVSANGFMRQTIPLKPAVNGGVDMGTIELKRGFKLSGVVKEKSGKPLPLMTISVKRGEEVPQYTRMDSEGGFVFDGLEPGTYSVGVRLRADIKPITVSVGPGKNPAPFELLVDSATTPPPLSQMQGRVVDSSGLPVAGAKIVLSIGDPRQEWQTMRAVSELDGRFTSQFAESMGIPKIGTVKRPGYSFSKADELKKVDGVWQTTIVLQSRGSALRGHVLDADGKPVTGAYVSLTGHSDAPIVPVGEDGAFALPDVPLEGVTIVASNGPAYSETKVEKASADVKIVLPTGAPQTLTTAEATSLADKLWLTAQLESTSWEGWNEYWDILGPERMRATAERAKSEWTWTQYVETLAQRDPKALLGQIDEIRASLPPNVPVIEALVARVQARSDDPTQRAKAQAWLQAHNKPSLEIAASGVSSLLRIGSVAEALQPGGSTKWVDFAAQIAAQLSDKTRLKTAEEWGETAALIGPMALENLVQEWGSNAQFRAYKGATLAFTETGNPKSAADYLKLMEATLPDTEHGRDHDLLEDYEERPGDALKWVRNSFAVELAKTDPAAALPLALEVGEYYAPSLLVEIGTEALKRGDKELAGKALRQLLNSSSDDADSFPQAADVALEFDPKLAQELFQAAWEQARRNSGEANPAANFSLAAYAQARAKRWPGESRLIIEREWAQRLPAFDPKDETWVYSSMEALKRLAAAMTVISPQRAIEMAAQLPENLNLRAEGRARVAVKLLEMP